MFVPCPGMYSYWGWQCRVCGSMSESREIVVNIKIQCPSSVHRKGITSNPCKFLFDVDLVVIVVVNLTAQNYIYVLDLQQTPPNSHL